MTAHSSRHLQSGNILRCPLVQFCSAVDTLQAAKFKSPLLVWRPVLSALHALTSRQISAGQRVGVVCHNEQGVSLQELQITSDNSGTVAPERRAMAWQIECPLGYGNLFALTQKAALNGENFGSRTEHRVRTKSVGRAALGMGTGSEMLRASNADWERLDLGDFDVAASLTKLPLFDCSADFDVLLVESLSQGKVREVLLSWISNGFPGPVVDLKPHSVAFGALDAALRCAQGRPVYFDFLPKLSTIVFGTGGASSFDLIRPGETVRAGEIYRSPEPARLAIPKGNSHISIYLNKEDQPRPRKAKINLGAPVPQQCGVELSVEQKPAAGRANIRLEARDLGQSFTVDWDAAAPDARAWDEIVADLTPKMSIPNRLVLPCAMHAWDGGDAYDGLSSLLQSESENTEIDWAILAQKMPQRPFGMYAISSDGGFPSELQVVEQDRLADLNEKALQAVNSILRENGPSEQASELLRFLTWQFRNCPAEIIERLIECVETQSPEHPLVGHQARWKLIYHGLGRITRGTANESRVIQALLSTDISAWSWDRQSACMAFLLSRSDSAPCLLTREDVSRLANRAIVEFTSAREAFLRHRKWTLDYAPFLVAGLVRWRLKEPGALVAETDPLAADMLEAVEVTTKSLVSGRRLSPRLATKRDKFLPILKDLKSELSGQGKNPDILFDLYNAASATR